MSENMLNIIKIVDQFIIIVLDFFDLILLGVQKSSELFL